ncbi:MAG: histidine kinase [Saprospiraceae bacterium]|nr:histidine kinase [Candidatus Opimibacter skivensis]
MLVDAVVKLSSIVRYVISEAAQSTVPLRKEIKYVSNTLNCSDLAAKNIKP